jgi:hypothetical protein
VTSPTNLHLAVCASDGQYLLLRSRVFTALKPDEGRRVHVNKSSCSQSHKQSAFQNAYHLVSKCALAVQPTSRHFTSTALRCDVDTCCDLLDLILRNDLSSQPGCSTGHITACTCTLLPCFSHAGLCCCLHLTSCFVPQPSHSAVLLTSCAVLVSAVYFGRLTGSPPTALCMLENIVDLQLAALLPCALQCFGVLVLSALKHIVLCAAALPQRCACWRTSCSCSLETQSCRTGQQAQWARYTLAILFTCHACTAIMNASHMGPKTTGVGGRKCQLLFLIYVSKAESHVLHVQRTRAMWVLGVANTAC